MAFDEGDEYSVQQATVEKLEQQLLDPREAASRVRLGASSGVLLAGVLREQEEKLQVAKGVLQRRDLPCCDAGLRPLCAGSPGMQHLNAASCQRGSVEGFRRNP